MNIEVEMHEDDRRKLSECVFFVEANKYETICLWEEYKDTDSWKQDHLGIILRVGYVKNDKDCPVDVSFVFNWINGHRVCFYHTFSRYNDTNMVSDWISNNFPVKCGIGGRRAMTNAMNFHFAIEHTRKLSGRE